MYLVVVAIRFLGGSDVFAGAMGAITAIALTGRMKI